MLNTRNLLLTLGLTVDGLLDMMMFLYPIG
jgi:hypothetical protein